MIADEWAIWFVGGAVGGRLGFRGWSHWLEADGTLWSEVLGYACGSGLIAICHALMFVRDQAFIALAALFTPWHLIETDGVYSKPACIQENTLNLKRKTRQSYTCMLNSECVLNKKPLRPELHVTKIRKLIRKFFLNEIQMYCDIRVLRIASFG